MKLPILTLAFAALAIAAPHPADVDGPTKSQPLAKRATTICGPSESVQTGTYTIQNSLLGQASGTNSQCTTVDGISNSLLKWSTTWSWTGAPTTAKSFSKAVLKTTAERLASIWSIPTTWEWTYTGSSLVTNVAYHLLTNSNCGTGSPEYEVKIWLSALGGVTPLSTSGTHIGLITVDQLKWRIWKGQRGQTTVYTFVALDPVAKYNGNLNGFLRVLVDVEGVPSTQCLYSIGAGTETFTGVEGKFTTTGYNVSIIAGGTTPLCSPFWAQCGGVVWNGPTCCISGTCNYANEWHSQCL